jgi:hypothetical protein
MASKITNKKVVVEGIAEWPKVFESNRDKTGYKGAFEDTNGRTSINLILDDQNYGLLKQSGSLKRGTPDAEKRGTNVKVDRKWETDRDWECGAPAIYRADGNPWDLEVDGYIGNGSKVRVELVVTHFPDRGVAATRLEAIKVLELVPFESNNSMTKDESGGVGQPVANTATPEPTTPAPKAKPVAAKELEDEIPF